MSRYGLVLGMVWWLTACDLQLGVGFSWFSSFLGGGVCCLPIWWVWQRVGLRAGFSGLGWLWFADWRFGVVWVVWVWADVGALVI